MNRVVWEGQLEGSYYRVTQTDPEQAIVYRKVDGAWVAETDESSVAFVLMRVLLDVTKQSPRDLSAYTEFVQELARKNAAQRFPCGLPYHADIVLIEMLRRANRYVAIYTSRWNSNLTPAATRPVLLQPWTERERGWGSRPDGATLHLSAKDRDAFIKEYNSKLPEEVPDEYSHPDGDTKVVDLAVDDELYKRLAVSKNGLWILEGQISELLAK